MRFFQANNVGIVKTDDWAISLNKSVLLLYKKCLGFNSVTDLLNVGVHVIELAVKTSESHDLVGDLLRESSDRRVLDVTKEMFDTDLFRFLGADFRLQHEHLNNRHSFHISLFRPLPRTK